MTLPILISQKLHYEWKLRSFETAFMLSTVFIGYLTDSVTFSWLSDKHGTKWFCVIGGVISLDYGILSVFPENFLWFFIMILCVGIGMGCAINGTCYLVEYLGIYQRSKAIVAVNTMSSIGSLYAPLVVYIVMEKFGWKIYLLCTTFPFIFIVPMFLWLWDSFRYLYSTSQYDQLIEISQKKANLNKKKASIAQSHLQQQKTLSSCN